MHIKFISDLSFDIYLKKEIIQDINLKDKSSLEKYLKNLFKLLKDKYNIIIEGFYEVEVYIDKFYGVILHLEKDDSEYYDYFKNQVDMRISILDKEFIYEVEDIPKSLQDKVDIYIKENKIYLKIKNKLSKLEMMKLLECSKLQYNK